MILRKIHLETLINILQEIYNSGADYVDISGEETDVPRDTIKIEALPEYFIEQEEEASSFSDEDVNSLI